MGDARRRANGSSASSTSSSLKEAKKWSDLKMASVYPPRGGVGGGSFSLGIRSRKVALMVLALIATDIVILVSQLIYSVRVDYSFTISAFSIDVHGSTSPYSLWNGVGNYWDAGGHLLAVFIAVWSGVWPHFKLLVLLSMLLIGPDQYPLGYSQRRKLIHFFNWLGRWSLLDVHVAILVMVIFQTSAFMGDNVLVGSVQAQPLGGILLFCGGVVATQILSRLMGELNEETKPASAIRSSSSNSNALPFIFPCSRKALASMLIVCFFCTLLGMFLPFASLEYGSGISFVTLKRTGTGGNDLTFFTALASCVADSEHVLFAGRALAFASMMIVLLGMAWNACLIACLWSPAVASGRSRRGEHGWLDRLYYAVDVGAEFQHVDLLTIAILIVASQIGIMTEHFHPKDLPVQPAEGKPLLSIAVDLKFGAYMLIASSILLDVVCGYVRHRVLVALENEDERNAADALGAARIASAFSIDGDGDHHLDNDDDGSESGASVKNERTPLIVNHV